MDSTAVASLASVSSLGENDPVRVRAGLAGVASSRSLWPQYMQKKGASAPSSVERERWQRGQVMVMQVRERGRVKKVYGEGGARHKPRRDGNCRDPREWNRVRLRVTRSAGK